MTKVNLDRPLLLQDGETPMPLRMGEDPGVATLKEPVMGALLADLPADSQTPGLKYRLYTLQHLCRKGGDVELDANDVDLIDKRSMLIHPSWLYGQVADALNDRVEPVDRPLAQPAPMPELPQDDGRAAL